MAKLGDIVTFHTVHGDLAAIVTGHGKSGDDDTQLAVFANETDADTGLSEGVNQRWSHEDNQAGGFTS
jgi:hypothetical protein